jgi:hypothetical protein
MVHCAGEQDADDASTEEAAEGGRGSWRRGPALSYAMLYDALARGLTNERSVLLLYDLLHDCQHFHNYVLVRRCWPLALLLDSRVSLQEESEGCRSALCNVPRMLAVCLSGNATYLCLLYH